MKVENIKGQTNHFNKITNKHKKIHNFFRMSTKKVGFIGVGALLVMYIVYKSIDYIQKMYRMYLYKKSKRREEKLYEKYCGHKLNKLG